MLQVTGVSVEVAGRVVVTDVTFSLRPGEVAGLVGRFTVALDPQGAAFELFEGEPDD